MLRQIYALRRSGKIALTGRRMQILVKSSMIMEVEAHNERLDALLPLLETGLPAPANLVNLHLSGHFCHAPRPELLDIARTSVVSGKSVSVRVVIGGRRIIKK